MDGIQGLISKLENGFKEQVEKLKKDLGTMRTGRANAQILDNVKVEYYDTLTPLKQVGAITILDARTLQIQPWDATALEAIEKALQKADLGAQPVSDGHVVRLSLPAMTEERRVQLVKTIKKVAEDFKVIIRNHRRDTLEKIKKAQKSGEISEDDLKRFEQNVQKLTDSYISNVDEVTGVKEKEIMTV
jgi:ribosome recycling factor